MHGASGSDFQDVYPKMTSLEHGFGLFKQAPRIGSCTSFCCLVTAAILSTNGSPGDYA